jgi:hypothetical protein
VSNAATIHVFGILERDESRQVLAQALASSKCEKANWMASINKLARELEASGIRKDDAPSTIAVPGSPSQSLVCLTRDAYQRATHGIDCCALGCARFASVAQSWQSG